MTSPTPITQDATPPQGQHYNPSISPNVLVIAVVVLVVAIIGAAVGLNLKGGLADTTPLLTTLLGFVGPVVVGLVTLLKVDKAGQQTSALTNGLLDTKVQNAVRAVLNEPQTPGTGDRPANTLYTPDGAGPNATTVTPPTSPTSPADPGTSPAPAPAPAPGRPDRSARRLTWPSSTSSRTGRPP